MPKTDIALFKTLFGRAPTNEELATGIFERNPGSKKTGSIIKLNPRGATAGERKDTIDEVEIQESLNAMIGRPLERTAEQIAEPKDTTVWCEGEAFFADLNDPTLLRILDLVSDISREPYPLCAVIIDNLDPSIPPVQAAKTARTWTNKRVTERDFLAYLIDHPNSTVPDLALALFGPFTDGHAQSIARRNHAEAKVRTRLYRLVQRAYVVKQQERGQQAKWRATRSLTTLEATHPAMLGRFPAPEPRRGRVRLTIEGTAFVYRMHEERNQATSELVALLEPLGIRVHTVSNELADSDTPQPGIRTHKKWPNQRRCDVAQALLTLRDIRTGLHTRQRHPEDPAQPLPPEPALCYFAFWARKCYWGTHPTSPSPGPPMLETQRHMEAKAYKMLRGLIDRRLVLRRKAPDGKLILFLPNDPEAQHYPPG